MEAKSGKIFPENKTYGENVLDYVEYIRRSNITSTPTLDNLMDLTGRITQRKN